MMPGKEGGADEMTKICSCGLSHRLDDVKPIFIQPGAGAIPALVAFHCACRSTLSVFWTEAPHIMRQRALAAEMDRLRKSGVESQ